MFGACQKPGAVFIGQVGAKKNQQRERHRSDQSCHEAEVADFRTLVTKPERIDREEGERNHGGHSKARRPETLIEAGVRIRVRGISGRSIQLVPILIGDLSGEGEPQETGKEGNIVQAAGVVPMVGDGHIDRKRGEQVGGRGAEEVGIDNPPGSPRPQPKRAPTGNDHHVLNVGKQIVVEIVLFDAR